MKPRPPFSGTTPTKCDLLHKRVPRPLKNGPPCRNKTINLSTCMKLSPFAGAARMPVQVSQAPGQPIHHRVFCLSLRPLATSYCCHKQSFIKSYSVILSICICTVATLIQQLTEQYCMRKCQKKRSSYT